MKRLSARTKQRRIYRGRRPTEPIGLPFTVCHSLPFIVCRWIATLIVCLAIGVVLSPPLREEFSDSLRRGGNGWNVLLYAGGVTILVLVSSISATQRVIQKAREEYHRPVSTPDLPARDVLVRSAQEPSAPSETLLRAGVKGEETKAEELLRVVPGTVETP